MKYHPEKRANDLPPQQGLRALTLWIIGFPGYIIFLLSWLLVLAGIAVRLTSWFIGANQSVVVTHSSGVAGHGLVFGPFAALLASALVIVTLGFAYWISVGYTVRFIRGVADFLETSQWVIKLVGLPLGCGLAAICAMLFRPEVRLEAIAIAGGLAVVGLCSFGLEYAYLRSLR